MNRIIKYLLNKTKYVQELNLQISKQGKYPAGHYYSPVPDSDEILEYIKSREHKTISLPDIKLNKERQYSLLEDYAGFYDELSFPEHEDFRCRYYYENIWYSYSDAIFLNGFLRKFKPKRIVEVGSGFSSAVMLDTIDKHYQAYPDVVFIDPFPQRLNSLLSDDDVNKVRIIDKKIQDVPLDIFSSLSDGDLLFIDSSHVVKSGSDLQLIMFEILPLLQSGVFVHFHDIFYPFEQPSKWLEEGMYWNENYFIRAFLSNNDQWDILFFNTYVAAEYSDFIKEQMPLCVRNVGGSLYIQRK